LTNDLCVKFNNFKENEVLVSIFQNQFSLAFDLLTLKSISVILNS
jgi:hypothetical protein